MSANPNRSEVDQLQVDQLCAEVEARAAAIRAEEALLEQLVTAVTPARRFRAAYYRRMLAEVRAYARRLRNLAQLYCRL